MADITKVLIYNNEFGTITVVHPSRRTKQTWDEIQAGIGTVLCPDQQFHLVNRSDVPTDRTFRDAWTYTP